MRRWSEKPGAQVQTAKDSISKVAGDHLKSPLLSQYECFGFGFVALPALESPMTCLRCCRLSRQTVMKPRAKRELPLDRIKMCPEEHGQQLGQDKTWAMVNPCASQVSH